MDANPEGHGGETREQRIEKFLEISPELCVAGLCEGTMLRVEDLKMRLIGNRNSRIFRKGASLFKLFSNDDLSFLL